MDRQYIDSTIERLRQEYGITPAWQKIAVDNNIKVVLDNRFISPFSHMTEAGLIYVGIQQDCKTPYGEWVIAHEFGHVLLGHLYSALPVEVLELEADYFAIEITGRDVPLIPTILQGGLNILKHPLLSLSTILGFEKGYGDYTSRILGL